MGLFKPFSSCSCPPTTDESPSRKLTRHRILKQYLQNGVTAFWIKYPEATNFEGVKILVIKGEYQTEALSDPHFCENSPNYLIARFRPTEEGWALAKRFCESYEKM